MPPSLLRGAAVSALLLTAACAGMVPPPHGEPDPAMVAALDRFEKNSCNREVASVLTGAGVSASDIRAMSVYTVPRYPGITLYGPEAYVGLNGQSGSIVIPMSEDCKARQIYTTGGANVPGMSRW